LPPRRIMPAPYPTSDRRSTDTELPNRIANAGFQTACARKICLNKRTQDGNPPQRFDASRLCQVPFHFHHSQPYAPVSSVSLLG
jgi:hypothetical protein